MPLFEGKPPAERYKTIAALALGIIALLFLARMFFGSSTPTRNTNTTGRTRTTTTTTSTSTQVAAPLVDDPMQFPQPVVYQPIATAAPEAGRNIFTFYEAPVRKTNDAAIAVNVPPPPPPPPPLTLSGVVPGNVFAQTDSFTLAIAGDKFTPETRVYVDSQEVPTTFTNMQQLAAQIPATLIATPGTRQILVRTPDGQLYSNPLSLNVAEPPKPQFTYVGLLGTRHYGNDKAMLKSPTNEVMQVQRGDVVGGRFRVTSISDRSVDFMDTQLRIKHTLPYVDSRTGAAGQRPPYIPQPARTDDDEEPLQ